MLCFTEFNPSVIGRIPELSKDMVPKQIFFTKGVGSIKSA